MRLASWKYLIAPAVVAAVLAVYPEDVQAETLTLEEVLDEVSERHETREITEMQIRQSRAMRRQALAALFPQLNASAEVTRQGGEEVETQVGVIRQRYDWSAGATTSLTLFDGPAYFEYWRADALLEATEYSADWQRHLLELEAEVAFYSLASVQREVEIAEAAIEWRREYLERAEALREAGMAVAVDVSRARTDLLEAEQALLEAEARLGDTADSMATLMARRPDGQLRADFDPRSVEATVPRQVDPITEARADMASRRATIEATELGRRAIWWSLAPRLDLRLNTRWSETTAFNPDVFNWSVTLAATWNLYDGGARYARADAAQADVREQELVLERELRDADVDRVQARRSWRTAVAAIELAREQREVAEETLEQTMAQFEVGLVTSLEVSDASQQLLEAEQGLNQRLLEARLAEVQYRYLQSVPE